MLGVLHISNVSLKASSISIIGEFPLRKFCSKTAWCRTAGSGNASGPVPPE